MPNRQEARKQRSGRSLTEESRDEGADKKRGMFFSWSRNRSFGKGPKKKDVGDINLGENECDRRAGSTPVPVQGFGNAPDLLMRPRTGHPVSVRPRVAMSAMRGGGGL